MNMDQFDFQMKRLIGTYGDKAYPDERKRQLWIKFNSLEVSQFSEILDLLIGNCLTPPMISRFEETLSDLRNRKWIHQKNNFTHESKSFYHSQPEYQIIRSQCSYCADSGVIHANKRETSYKFTFKCSCKLGALRRENWPVWDLHFENRYQLN